MKVVIGNNTRYLQENTGRGLPSLLYRYDFLILQSPALLKVVSRCILILYLSLFSHFWYISIMSSLLYSVKKTWQPNIWKIISNIFFAKLLFKIKLWLKLNLSSYYQHWFPLLTLFCVCCHHFAYHTDLKCCFFYESILGSSNPWWPLPLMNSHLPVFFTFILCVINALLFNYSVPMIRL